MCSLKVLTSSTCGATAREYCFGDRCVLCDGAKANSPDFLTDLHNPANETCWVADQKASENVTLTISLRKKYELTYVSLHFCSAKPNHMAILKSMDHGRTWQPFQYYSDDCVNTFAKRPEVSASNIKPTYFVM